MSRTWKDAPYRIREKRAGVGKDEDDLGFRDGCNLCQKHKENPASRVVELTTIFFAHEAKSLEALKEAAEENGFEVKITEVSGFLGRVSGESYPWLSYKFNMFDGLYDPQRAIYKHPRGVEEFLLYSRYGKHDPSNSADRSQHQRMALFSAQSWSPSTPVHHVSHKANIFKVVQLSKEVEARHYRWHDHGEGDYPYWKIKGRHHRSYGGNEEFLTATQIRALESEAMKTFNGEGEEALDEIDLVTESLGEKAPSRKSWW